MENIDEKIAETINQYKMGCYGDIESGIYVKEQQIFFKKTELFDGQVVVMLPETYIDMPLVMQEIKYPSVHRPQIIKCNEEGDINFTFSLLESPLEKESVQSTMKQMKKLIRKVQPSNVFHDEGVVEKESTSIGWFDYKSPTMDESLFNLMYCASINGKTLQGVFNAPYYEWKIWKDIMIAVVGTIECVEKVNHKYIK